MAVAALLLAVVLDALARPFFPDFLGLADAPPSLAFLTALYVGFRAKDAGQLHLAVLLGAFQDCFSSWPIGHFAFLYGLGAYLAWRVRRYLPPDAAMSYAVAVFFCGIVVAFAGLLLAVAGGAAGAGSGLARASFAAVTAALCAPAVFALWDRSRMFRRAFAGVRYPFSP